VRIAILVGLDNKDAHAWECFRDGALTAECKVLPLVDGRVAVHLLQPPFFVVVGIKPDLAVRVGGMESLNKRRRTGRQQVFGGDKVRWGIVGRGAWSKKRADGSVTRN
jgi:hypothetical protein